MSIRIRQLCSLLCIICLLLAVASAGLPDPFHDTADSPNSGDAAAAGRVNHARDICYNTVTHVPSECAGQFIRAMFTGRTVETYPITTDCCHQLACVREWSCADVLRGVCLPPEKDQCPPPPVMARASTATTTKQ